MESLHEIQAAPQLDTLLDTPPFTTDVLLVSMPFGPLLQPSIALSLLRGSLEGITESIATRYFTLDFAERVGAEIYVPLSEGYPITFDMAGEWLFNVGLFDPDLLDDEGYIREVLRGENRDHRIEHSNQKPLSEPQIQKLLAVRAEVVPFLDWCAEEVMHYRPKIVAFTSVFQQNVASLALAKRLKVLEPNLVVMIGGANCEGAMGTQMVRSFPFVDVVVSGEGEGVFPRLVQSVLEDSPLPPLYGVYTPEHPSGMGLDHAVPRRDMDELALLDYDEFFEQYRGKLAQSVTSKPRLMFETSRGCWWGEKNHCTFCGLNGSSMTFRSKSADRALKELLHLTERYPGFPVSVVDNILDMKYFKDFIPMLIERELDLELFYEVKANLRKEQVRLLAEAGIRVIQPGIESLSNQVLTEMNKGVRGLHNVQLLKWCKEYGVTAHWNILWGFPREDPEEYRRMAEMVPLIRHLRPPSSYAQIRLDRFSPNFDHAEKLGFAHLRAYPAYGFTYPLEPEAVFNLAYFFAYDYQQERDLAAYTAPLIEATQPWKRDHTQLDLFYFGKGPHTVVCDLRELGEPQYLLLSALEGRMLEVFDEMKTLEQAQRASVKTGTECTLEDVEAAVNSLLERRLMLRDGALYLSLPIALGVYSPNKAVLERLQAPVLPAPELAAASAAEEVSHVAH